jgi:luciferase family oxidoreductase group 1
VRPLRLGVVDQSPVAEGSTGSHALRNSIALAGLADRLGFHRYWVAEHHGGGLVAGPSPEVLVGPIASATERLRVGSGGVMLPHYSPFKVAENFSVLAGLFPGRIDLGLGRAFGTDPQTAHALLRDRSRMPPDDFRAALGELLALLSGRFPADHPLARLAAALPGLPEAPEPWLLGSSEQSALWAAELGLPYAFADFINAGGAPYAATYRARYADTEARPSPTVIIGVWALAAETEEEAHRLAASARMAFTLLMRGRLGPVPPVETALRWLASEGIALGSPEPRRRTIVGTPDQVRAGIEAVAEEYAAEEVLVVTITHDEEARQRSYALLAEAFALDRPR